MNDEFEVAIILCYALVSMASKRSNRVQSWYKQYARIAPHKGALSSNTESWLSFIEFKHTKDWIRNVSINVITNTLPSSPLHDHSDIHMYHISSFLQFHGKPNGPERSQYRLRPTYLPLPAKKLHGLPGLAHASFASLSCTYDVIFAGVRGHERVYWRPTHGTELHVFAPSAEKDTVSCDITLWLVNGFLISV